MTTDNDVAIVGMACVLPKAADLRQYWSNLVNGVDAIEDAPAERWADRANFRLSPDHEAFLPGRRGGFIPADFLFDPAPHHVLPNLVRHGDPDQFLALHVIDQALRDAGVAADDPVRQRTDVIVGRGGYLTGKLVEMNMRMEVFEAVLSLMDRRFPEMTGNGRREELEQYLRSTLTPPESDNVSTAIANLTASRAANRLNLRGSASVVDGACASSLLAVEDAVWRLRAGRCDVAVVAALFLSQAPTMLYVFSSVGALSPSQTIRPFDRRADGLVAGEGGGAVALKRLADARRDGNAIYAVIKGVGSSSDGREVDVMAPASAGQVLALERAFADARVDKATIGYLEAHGTGTLVGDLTEIATIKSFFGSTPRHATARAMGSVKSMIGHTMPAAGMASLLKTSLALSNKILPPSLHCEEPRPELADAPFYMNTQTRPWVHSPARGPRRAGINAFGFGGINAHLILERVGLPGGVWANGWPGAPPAEASDVVTRPIGPELHRDSELIALAGDSEEDVDEQVRHLQRFLEQDRSGATLADIAWSLTRRLDLGRPVKLVLVCPDQGHLRQLSEQWLARPAGGLPPGSEELYFSAQAAQPPGKVAFIFPGTGFPGLIGTYPDRLMELCLHFPEVRAEFDFFEDRDRHPDDDVPTSAIFCPPLTWPAWASPSATEST